MGIITTNYIIYTKCNHRLPYLQQLGVVRTLAMQFYVNLIGQSYTTFPVRWQYTPVEASRLHTPATKGSDM